VNQHGLRKDPIFLFYFPNSWFAAVDTSASNAMLICSSPPFKSPYYNESHRRLQKAMRIFTDKELYPVAQDCEKTGKHIPQELIDSMAKKGILHMRIGPGKHLHGVELMNGAVSVESRFHWFPPPWTC
jgi:Acyl-CoA dehydrogenase, N-terminal domain